MGLGLRFGLGLGLALALASGLGLGLGLRLGLEAVCSASRSAETPWLTQMCAPVRASLPRARDAGMSTTRETSSAISKMSAL